MKVIQPVELHTPRGVFAGIMVDGVLLAASRLPLTAEGYEAAFDRLASDLWGVK